MAKLPVKMSEEMAGLSYNMEKLGEKMELSFSKMERKSVPLCHECFFELVSSNYGPPQSWGLQKLYFKMLFIFNRQLNIAVSTFIVLIVVKFTFFNFPFSFFPISKATSLKENCRYFLNILG